MDAPCNAPEPTRWRDAQPGFGAPSPGLLARSDQGLARFLDHVDDYHEDRESEDGAG